MKYIFLFFWSALLFTVLNYVVSAIGNYSFGLEQVKSGLFFSLFFSVMILIISAIIPNESPKEVGTRAE